jgi:hypothetical protein
MNQTRNTSKLPAWVQQHVALLENRLAATQAKLTADPEDSDTVADPFSDTPRPLGSGVMVRFGHKHEGTSFDVELEDGELSIRATVPKGEEMVIKPVVANSFTVTSVGRS